MTKFVKDPCGIICILITYLAIIYADYVVTKWIILQTMQNRLDIEKYLVNLMGNKTCSSQHLDNLYIFKSILFFPYVYSLWGPVHVVSFNTLIFLMVMAHLKAVFCDPGTVPLPQNRLDFSDLHSKKNRYSDDDEWTVCTRCETYRPPRAHHCRICKRCIRYVFCISNF